MRQWTSTSFSIPPELLAWVDAEAKRANSNRSKFILALIESARAHQMHERLERFEARLTALEAHLTPPTI